MRAAVGVTILVAGLLAGGEALAQQPAAPALAHANYSHNRTVSSGSDAAAAPAPKRKAVKSGRSRDGGEGRRATRQRGDSNCGYIRQAVAAATAAGFDNGVGLIARARAHCGG